MKKAIAVLVCILLLCSSAALADPPIRTEGIVIPVIEELKPFTVPENEAMAFARRMKAGWNLGNTFDAHDDEGWFKGSGAAMETAWGNPVTVPEVMDLLKEAGFNTLRLPVSWHNHVDENYTIDPAWMARVREVADAALSRGLFVIVNVHHDNHENQSAWFYPDEAHFDRSAAYLKAVWRQMAEAFADCDEHLILESLNEPRLVGTKYEWSWDPASAECKEAADCINRFNQLFVDTIRSTGGNNASRFLMVPGYAASPWFEVNAAFQLPKDSAENRLMVEAHAYTPYPFALQPDSHDSVFTLDDTAKKAEISNFLNQLYRRFVSRGIPVIMDEFGAVNRGGNLQDRVNFAAWYVASASSRGITCCWWDNGIFSGNGELFGILDRNTLQWRYPDIALAIEKNSLVNR